jgi:formate hydrogenlyase subunit 4
VLGASITLGSLVPLLGAPVRIADAVAIALTLGLWRFMLVLAALETRSAFEGMAASREMTFGSLTEAPLILALASLVFGGGTILADVLASAALLMVCLSETARVPVDNQETHYELTMIHEGLILEYSGWHLALLQYASWLRQLSLLLLAAILLPGGASATLIWLLAFIVAIPLIERIVAKMRLFEVPALFAAATILALTSIVMHIVRAIS